MTTITSEATLVHLLQAFAGDHVRIIGHDQALSLFVWEPESVIADVGCSGRNACSSEVPEALSAKMARKETETSSHGFQSPCHRFWCGWHYLEKIEDQPNCSRSHPVAAGLLPGKQGSTRQAPYCQGRLEIVDVRELNCSTLK
jgi:hypothetical protein